MKKILLLLASGLPLLFSSCTKTVITDVQDNSFDIGTRLYYDSERLCHAVSVNLLSGIEGDYSVAYTIDGVQTTGLNIDGGNFTSGDKVYLSKVNDVVFYIPSGEKGKHKLAMTFSREGVKRSVNYEYDEDIPLVAKVTLNEQETVLVLEDTGRAGLCELSFKLDNDKFEGILKDGVVIDDKCAVNFRETPQVAFTLPAIAAGEHIISIKVVTKSIEYVLDVTFTEPSRSKVQTRLYYESALMCNVLEFSLSRGESIDCKVSYIIDENPSLLLQKQNRADFLSGESISLSSDSVVKLLLPNNKKNRHTVRLVLQYDGIETEYSLEYTDRPVLDAEVVTNSGEAPKLILSSVGKSSQYTVSFALNGKRYDQMKYNGVYIESDVELDFTAKNTYEFDFSSLKMGQYRLDIDVKNQFTQETVSVYFEVKKPERIHLNFVYSKEAQKLELTSFDNFTGEEFSIQVSVDMKGKIFYTKKGDIENGVHAVSNRPVSYLERTEFRTVTPTNKPADIDNQIISKVVGILQEDWEWHDDRSNRWQRYEKFKVELFTEPTYAEITLHILGPEGHEGKTPVAIDVHSMLLHISKPTYYYRKGGYKEIYPTYNIKTKDDVLIRTILPDAYGNYPSAVELDV